MRHRSNVDKFFQKQAQDPEYRVELILAEISTTFAEQLKQKREKSNLSQADLAEKLCTKQSQISRLENPAYARYSLRTLARIANALNCDLSVSLVPKVNPKVINLSSRKVVSKIN